MSPMRPSVVSLELTGRLDPVRKRSSGARSWDGLLLGDRVREFCPRTGSRHFLQPRLPGRRRASARRVTIYDNGRSRTSFVTIASRFSEANRSSGWVPRRSRLPATCSRCQDSQRSLVCGRQPQRRRDVGGSSARRALVPAIREPSLAWAVTCNTGHESKCSPPEVPSGFCRRSHNVGGEPVRRWRSR